VTLPAAKGRADAPADGAAEKVAGSASFWDNADCQPIFATDDRWFVTAKPPADTAPGRRWLVRNELNVLALIKGAEHYVYVYDDRSRQLLLEMIQAQAADPELSLNWFDAAILAEKAREQALAAGPPPRF
jgi:hypothetical protein